MPAHTVTVRFFAVLRERSGADRLTIESAAENLRDLYREMATRFPLGLAPSLVKFAVGGHFVSDETPLEDGMEIALIPPVAGG